LELVYTDAKTEEQCTSLKAAKNLFGGNDALAKSLFARINALKQAETIKDIIVQPTFHFHKLENKGGRHLEGYFAIDVKSRRDQWRIILEPLDENKEPYVPCNIDEISQNVRIVEIMEVSKHYE
jgi:plasmid maintenance system killer protein